MEEKYTCCICGKEFEGLGNNPYPLKEEERCCDECNKQVIYARLVNLAKRCSEQ